ncbi:MAG: hypothetical protein COV10_02995 [Candidatus Vogelbacteria bacterium CG10_big_fil_rev_8_21_14_0_10_51_16]|uniref:PLD phosphodiesterase domain-containing protein n=1 Tax=Candidatus Vogelbacteria bacterium CG10_big_fil_rev_8_21_14_0_10_51_16 TaxID=1975045 RepID=A0A2H0RGA3_9BACT|nr:MAG: hypothetical protein COV10_02995 [Candidatus Vogelbacteria bacterium CG10_big_fil_rev_8_21_14_0_10_51_16]
MSSKIYHLSGSAIDAMYKATEAARHSIYWESYIFRNDVLPAHDFIEIFARKAREGLRVVIILDGFGSADLPREERAKLISAGVELLFFSSWFRRIHRKLLIIDERVAFFGGVNVGKQYIRWLDLQMRVSGRFVNTLLRSFAKSYALCGGLDKRLLEMKQADGPVKRLKMRLVEHWPLLGKLGLRKHYEARIRTAKQRLVIVSPYFIPHRWLIDALLRAKRRGVSVEVILPRDTDPKIGSVVNYIQAERLYRKGLHFFFTKEMIHAKALLVDDIEGMIGSQNIDALSFDHNVEMGAVFRQKRLVADLERIVARWKLQSIPYEKLDWHPKWYHKALGKLIDILQPVL